jgi:hypothetical protein
MMIEKEVYSSCINIGGGGGYMLGAEKKYIITFVLLINNNNIQKVVCYFQWDLFFMRGERACRLIDLGFVS